jgi:protein kinase C substrate 80K-H
MFPGRFFLTHFQSLICVVVEYLKTQPDGKFKCKDSGKLIPVEAFNDDYCDCSDGSDEPGTSACSGIGSVWGGFYCKNEGHLAATIPLSHVGDGICEAECCDGSDEREGLCENVCAAAHERYLKESEHERKLKTEGVKLKRKMEAEGQKYVKQLKEDEKRLRAELKLLQNDLEELKKRKEDVDKRSKYEGASKSKENYKKLQTVKKTLKDVELRFKTLKHQFKALELTLNGKKDADVVPIIDEAVFDDGDEEEQEIIKRAPIDVPSESSPEAQTEDKSDASDLASIYTKEILEPKLHNLLETWNSLNVDEFLEMPLLKDNDIDENAILPDSSSSLPKDEGKGLYETVTDTVFEYYDNCAIPIYQSIKKLVGYDTVPVDTESMNQLVAKVTKRYDEVVKKEEEVRKDLEQVDRELKYDFGPKNIFASLLANDDECLSFVTPTGEYKYEMCVYGEARQRKVDSNELLASLGYYFCKLISDF